MLILCVYPFRSGVDHLDNPGFSNPSAGSLDSAPAAPSVPASGDSSRRHCQCCRRRMSKLVFDRHTLCVGCWGAECYMDVRCEECLDWLRDVMEAYVKHRKSLLQKARKGGISCSPCFSASANPITFT